ncbi:MAG: glycoside hydrolase [Deferrisomatales bacterium]
MGARVALLWHMHQPYYRNPVGGEYRMPWTFLHAAKDYYDMLALAVEARARVTFNLVPSLLDQLQDYADPGVRDTFLDPLRLHPDELSRDAREDLTPRLFFAHLENQIRPLARYFELHGKSGRGGALSAAELLDLEVLFLLAWTGEAVRAEEPLVQRLLGRGRQYSQEDKGELLGLLHRVCERTVEAYRDAQDRGDVEISTTPYYHPILPLLLDVQSARAALPHATLPVIQRGFGGDALRQVRDARERYRELFGRFPAGFWPSEGSVSADALALLADEGVEWAASDEDILAASLEVSLTGDRRAELYRPHAFRSPAGREIAVFFRDKILADLIGFTYAAWEPKAAAEDFVGRLAGLAQGPARGGTISVILDGENAWEFYAENGAPFLRLLYRAIAAHPELDLATFSECRDGGRPLPRVHPGSWIYGSFSTWVGHPEKNRAWELLERTRCRLADEEARLDPDARELAWQEIRIAEGSDWFWWLGDDHYTPLAGEFDGLFRLHLINVYRLAGLEPPSELHAPIKGGVRHGLLEVPVGPLRPRLDGRRSSYFEWLPAGIFDLGYDAGAMHRADRRLRRLRFGTGGGELHLCVEGEGSLQSLVSRGLHVEVEVLGQDRLRVRLPLDGGAASVLEGDAPGAAFAWGEVGEISLPLGAVGFSPPGSLYVGLRLVQGGEVLERAPLYHLAQLPIPADHDLESWSA